MTNKHRQTSQNLNEEPLWKCFALVPCVACYWGSLFCHYYNVYGVCTSSIALNKSVSVRSAQRNHPNIEPMNANHAVISSYCCEMFKAQFDKVVLKIN